VPPHFKKYILSTVVLTCSCLGQVTAAEFPISAIRFVVPFPAGGPSDILARLTGAEAGNLLGQRVVIDNRGGAGGKLGTLLVKQASPNGYTILLGTAATHAINVSLERALPYDPVADFAPITAISSVPYLLVVHPSVSSLDAFVRIVKRDPGKLSYGSSGNGTLPHLGMELLKSAVGINLVHVPYKGTAPTLTALLGGEVQASLVGIVAALSQVQTGKLRAVAITSLKRSNVINEIPTVAESGYPGFEAVTWFGLFAPAGTPARAIERLGNAFTTALNKEDLKQKVRDLGAETMGGSPKQFEKFVNLEITKWAAVVKSSGVRVD
jgi:tripartite-type tricarboxylate transporter receptor subunit TctC